VVGVTVAAAGISEVLIRRSLIIEEQLFNNCLMDLYSSSRVPPFLGHSPAIPPPTYPPFQLELTHGHVCGEGRVKRGQL
jgi:hypothetical protein